MSLFRLPLVFMCLLQLAGCQLYHFAAIQMNNQMSEPLWDTPNHESKVPLSLLQNLQLKDSSEFPVFPRRYGFAATPQPKTIVPGAALGVFEVGAVGILGVLPGIPPRHE